MFFRLTVAVLQLRIIDGPIPFRLDREGDVVNILLRAVTDRPDYSVVCEATAEIKPSKAAKPLIDAVWQKRVPEGFNFEKWPEARRRAYEESGVTEGELPLSALPNSLQNLIENAYSTIFTGIDRVIEALCWRTGQAVPTYDYQLGRMEWSLDGQEWRQSPVDFVAWMGRPPFVSGLAGPDINAILLSDDAPPFARELLREAWSEENKNPRSALVIGIAALETGIKDLIIGLIPETEWLIRNLQSPPVHRMLGEYLPLLRAKNQRVLCPSPEMVEEVQKWIGIRNELSHGKAADINVEKLTKFLLLVSDLLYAVDYARGFDWALELIQPETRKALGVP
jgi:hypothetical protein